MAQGDRAVEWRGGSLEELVAMLSGPALAARIEVVVPDGATRSERIAGEVHMVAGGVSEAFAGSLRGDEAMTELRSAQGARFRVEPSVPDPASGGIVPAGPEEGSLTERPLAVLMRYCEQFVMTCLLEVWRSGEHATISYRRGEIASTTVEGSDAPERLPEVMTWTDGHYRIVLPPLVLPSPPRPARVSEPRTLFGFASHEPSRPVRESAPRETLPFVAPPADGRGTRPGMQVDVFDPTKPERTTDVGVPPYAPSEATNARVSAEADTPLPATMTAPVPPAERTTPVAGPAARLSPMPPQPASLGLETTVKAPAPMAAGRTTGPVAPVATRPSTAIRTTRGPASAARTSRRVAVRRRTLSDLPVVAHVGLGLALGLAVVGAYWVVQGILAR